MSDTAQVVVLLSTFNGGVFLQAQLDSLYAQSHANVRILVRDDGSADTTVAILEREREAGRIEMLAGGSNLGAALSYLQLLRHAVESNPAYIAFCDQDDVWLPDKISRALAELAKVDDTIAALYCSRLNIVDADLQPVALTPLPKKIGFGNALVENIAVGCTVVLNRPAMQLIAQNMPAKLLIHDWWCYAVLSCFGRIIFDDEPSIQYRQHGGNAFGAAAGSLGGLGRKLRRFTGAGAGRHWQSEQAAALLHIFRERMPHTQRALLEKFVAGSSSFSQRFSLAMSSHIWRQKTIDDMAQRVLFLLNRY